MRHVHTGTVPQGGSTAAALLTEFHSAFMEAASAVDAEGVHVP